MEQFEHYYENNHAPLVLRITSSMSRYVRNYIKVDSTFQNLDSMSSSVCDVVTEAWFNTEDDLRKFQEDTAPPEVRKIVIEDEVKFLDRESIRMFLVKECES